MQAAAGGGAGPSRCSRWPRGRRAAGQLGVDGVEDGVADDAVELGGAADRLVDAADAAGGGIRGAVGAMLALPERMLGVGHGRAQK